MVAPHPLADSDTTDALTRATGRSAVELEQAARTIHPITPARDAAVMARPDALFRSFLPNWPGAKAPGRFLEAA